MKILMIFVTVLALSTVARSQDVKHQNIVSYDPLFWKDKLKLDDEQCQKIREINGEYYQNLSIAYKREKDNLAALRKLADESLDQRNQEIWETFHNKQKKRWKKMWSASTVVLPQSES
jgi:hypothetical protein